MRHSDEGASPVHRCTLALHAHCRCRCARLRRDACARWLCAQSGDAARVGAARRQRPNPRRGRLIAQAPWLRAALAARWRRGRRAARAARRRALLTRWTELPRVRIMHAFAVQTPPASSLALRTRRAADAATLTSASRGIAHCFWFRLGWWAQRVRILRIFRSRCGCRRCDQLRCQPQRVAVPQRRLRARVCSRRHRRRERSQRARRRAAGRERISRRSREGRALQRSRVHRRRRHARSACATTHKAALRTAQTKHTTRANER
jgi:hypothetical protein